MSSLRIYLPLALLLVIVTPACPESSPRDGFPEIDRGQLDSAGEADGQTVDSAGDQVVDAPVDETVTDLAEDTPTEAVDVPEDPDLAEDTPTDSAGDIGEELTDLSSDPVDSDEPADGDSGADSDPDVEPDTPDDPGTDLVTVPVRLTFGAATSTRMEIMMENDVAIKGYSFIAAGVNLTGAGGGRTQASGLNQISHTGSYVQALSLTGSSIPPGEGVLIVLQFDETVSDLCLNVSSDSGYGFVGGSDEAVEAVIAPACYDY